MILTAIKQKYQAWKDRRFLKQHGCDTWAEYHHRFDPDRNERCTRVKDYYHGYPWWHAFENRHHYCYKLLYDHGPGGYRYGYHDIIDWCREHSKHKHRTDFLRAIKHHPNGQWELDDWGGSDHIFVAFKDPHDYMLFCLKWS